MAESSVNPANYEHVAPFPGDGSDYRVHVIVETPRATRHKYAFDPQTGLFKLKKTIPEGLQWPYDYGFVPGTLGGDGDPLDSLYLNDEPTFPGCLVEARLLGIICLKKNGEQNDRLIACADRVDGISLSTDPYERVDDLPKAMLDSLRRFLVEYAERSGDEVVYEGIDGRKKALQTVTEGIAAFNDQRRKR